MAKNALGTLWPSKTLNLREPRLAQPGGDVPKLPKVKMKTPKPSKLVGLPKLGGQRFKRFGAL